MESNDETSYFGNDGYQNSAAVQSQQPFNNNAAANPNPNKSALGLFNISKKKLLLTIVYCISFWNFGICVAIFGPTLLDLACQTSSSLSAMTVLYFFQNFTSLLGCLLSGYLVKNKKQDLHYLTFIYCILTVLISIRFQDWSKRYSHDLVVFHAHLCLADAVDNPLHVSRHHHGILGLQHGMHR